MKTKLIILPIFIIIIIFTISSIAFSNANKNLQTLVKGNSAFGFDLYQKLKGKEGNLFFSPYSISTALAMTYAGARGQTKTGMAEVLHFFLKQNPLHSSLSTLQSKLNAIQDKGHVEFR